MANVSLAPTIGAFYQSFLDGGLPNNAGYIDTFIAGGTTPQATYTTSAGNVQNANPIVLGPDGRPPNEVWFVNGAAYRCDVYDALGNLIDSFDNLVGAAASISGTYLPTAGGTMSGNIAMGGNKVTGLAAATANGDAVRYEQSPAGLLTAKGSLITASAANVPAVLAIGTNGQAPVANTNATTGFSYGYPAMRSYLSGCTMSTAGSSTTMSIADGIAVDSTNVSAMVVAAISKTTSAWAVGSGNGGKLSAAAIANNTWYHWYAIQRVDTGVVDVGFDTNATSPTLPTNYTLFRRIGSGLTNGSAQWVSFVQYGDLFELLANVQSVATTNPGTSAITPTLTTPLGVKVRAWISAVLNNVTSSGTYVLFTDPAQTDSAATNAQNSLAAGGNGASNQVGGEFYVTTNTSSQIRYRLSSSGVSDVMYINTRGWIDRRGQDA